MTAQVLSTHRQQTHTQEQKLSWAKVYIAKGSFATVRIATHAWLHISFILGLNLLLVRFPNKMSQTPSIQMLATENNYSQKKI